MTKPEGGGANDSEENATPERAGRGSRLRRMQHSGGGKRGRRPSRVDRNAKLERSRQSARECRARKKQKYQLLEETVTLKEKQILKLREKLDKYKNFCQLMDAEELPAGILQTLKNDDAEDAAKEEEEDYQTGLRSGASSSSPALHRAIAGGGAGDTSSDDDSD